MLFNSFEFLLFLPVVFTLYWLNRRKLLVQNSILVLASYFFYGWWSFSFLGLLFVSTVLDYTYGFLVAGSSKVRAKFFLGLSVVNNLGILGIFKYYNFFVSEISIGLELLNIRYDPLFLNFALPIGISFYTFHGMSYVFDIYRGAQRPVRSFLDYALFVSFFPLLVAGPIERAHHLLPQIQLLRRFNYSQAVGGLRLILWGLFKKVVVADSLAVIVDSMFSQPDDFNGFALIIGSVAFSFQIYGDFSGYSDIAMGVAKLFGFELLSNFKFPYFSRNIAEFWRRWHISLSSWFKDYLYVPLGGSRGSRLLTVKNTFIIFLVSGFWHGASWTFVFWGLIHSFAFLPILILNKNRVYVSEIVAANNNLPSFSEFVKMLSTFLIVTFAWVFFRAETVELALKFLLRIITDIYINPMQFLELPEGMSAFIYIFPLILGDWYLRRDERDLRIFKSSALRHLTYWILVILIFISFAEESSFIYFQF